MREIWAIVPVKTSRAAKQRLSAALDADARSRLAVAMLEDVLSAAAGASGLAGLLVATCDPVAREIGLKFGARILSVADKGQTPAVRSAMRLLADEGREAGLTLPIDIPLVTASEIEAVIASACRHPEFVIVPAHDRRGSNAILCAPPGHVPLSFGNDSFLPHLEAARRCGIEPTALELPGIGLDIDNPADLAAFLAVPSRTRTRQLLDTMTIDRTSAGENV
ncbi:MAG: 2-phospho-L-lactate guanylyltransferase [Pseudorhodoplanes sp.]